MTNRFDDLQDFSEFVPKKRRRFDPLPAFDEFQARGGAETAFKPNTPQFDPAEAERLARAAGNIVFGSQFGFNKRISTPPTLEQRLAALPRDPAKANRQLRNILIELNQPIQSNLRFGAPLEEQNAAIIEQIRRGAFKGAGFGVFKGVPGQIASSAGDILGAAGNIPLGRGVAGLGGDINVSDAIIKPLNVASEIGTTGIEASLRAAGKETTFGAVVKTGLGFPTVPTEEELARSRESQRAVLNLITGGGEGRGAAFNTLNENQEDRDILAQLVGGAVFDILNIGAGIQAARRASQAISTAIREGKSAVALKAAADTFESEARRLGLSPEDFKKTLETRITQPGATSTGQAVPNLQELFAAPPATRIRPPVPEPIPRLPTLVERNVYGIREPVESGLAFKENLVNAFNLTAQKLKNNPKFIQNTDISIALRDSRNIARPVIESQANRLSALAGAELRKAFDLADNGLQIPSLAGIDNTIPGAPTIADVAARFPLYRPVMTDNQIAFMERLRTELSPYREIFGEVGIEIGERKDIIEGGFYVPRGNSLEGNANVAVRVRSVRGRGKTGAERSAVFDSQAAGIEGVVDSKTGQITRWEYETFDAVINSHVRDVGSRVLDQHSSNYLLNLTDTAGNKVAKTSADFVPPALRFQHNGLINQLRGRRKTLQSRNVRTRAVGAEAIRQENRFLSTSERAGRAQQKFADLIDGYSPGELKDIRSGIRENINDAVDFARKVGRDFELIKQARVVLREGDLALEQNYKRLQGEIEDISVDLNRTQGFLDSGKGDPASGALTRIAEDFARVDAEMDALFPKADELFRKVDEQIEKGRLNAEQGAAARNGIAEGRRAERTEFDFARRIKVAERELRLLDAETRRAKRIAEQGFSRTEAAATRQSETSLEVQDFQKKLDAMAQKWREVIERSKRPPGRSGIAKLTGTSGHTFPDELAQSINKILLIEQPTPSAQLKDVAIDVVLATENLLRGLRATGDMSAAGIQGLVGAGNDQKAYGKAFVNMVLGFADKDVLGRHILEFDERMARLGVLNSSDWAEFGLRIGSAETEFRIGGGLLSEKISNLPIIKQANQAFGNFGDVLRLEWATGMLQDELARGKNIMQMSANGDLARITKATNNMTGWTPDKTFGDIGDLIFFAPRFLQSRLNTISLAAQGALPGATLEKRIAKHSLLRMIGMGTFLTVSVNAMLGNETDFNPIRVINGKPVKNPNFMRVRGFGRDFSIFGPWDSIGGGIILAATGDGLGAARQFSSATIGTAWDLITGTDAIGNPVPNGIFSDPLGVVQRLGENLVPFATQEIPQLAGEAIEGFGEGDLGQGFGGIAGIGAEFLGVKSGRLSVNERIDEARGISRKEYQGLSDVERLKFDKKDGVQELIKERDQRRRERQSTYQEFVDQRTDVTKEIDDTIVKLAETVGPGQQFRERFRELQVERVNRFDQIEDDFSEDVEFFGGLDPRGSEFRLAEHAYFASVFADDLFDRVTGTVNFELRDKREANIRQIWGDDLIDLVVADQNLRPAFAEGSLVAEMRSDQEVLSRDYWGILTNYVAAFDAAGPELGIASLFDRWRKEKDPQQQGFLLRANGGVLDRVLNGRKGAFARMKGFREANPTIEALLLKWEYSPFNKSKPLPRTEGAQQQFVDTEIPDAIKALEEIGAR